MEKTIHWLLDHRRFVIFLSAFLLVVLLVVNFFSHNAFIYLEVSGNSANDAVVTYASSDAENTKAGGAGLLLVSRETKSLLVTAGTRIKTQTKVEIPWYGFTDKKVTLTQDTNAEKVAYQSMTGTTCASYNPQLDKLLYYACRNPKTILKYDTPSNGAWTNKKVADIYYSNGEPKPYMGGVIGIAHVHATDAKEQGDIIYTTESGKAVPYEAPEETDHETINGAKLFTDTYDPTNNRFILVDQLGDIYLGTPSGSSVTYEKIPAPDNYDSSYNETHCAIKDESAYCYRGKSAVGDANHDASLDKSAGYEIVSTSFADNSPVTSTITGAEGVLNIDGIYVANGQIYAKVYKKLYRLDMLNGSYVMNEMLQNVDSVSGGNDLYAIQDKGVYKLDKTTSDFHQVFYSDNILPKTVYAVSDKVFIVGNTKGNTRTTYAYALNNERNTTPGKRMIDLLPLKSGVLTGSTDNDFVGNRMLVTLPVITTKATRGQSGIDTGEMEARKVDVLNALRAQDISIDEENIQFTY